MQRVRAGEAAPMQALHGADFTRNPHGADKNFNGKPLWPLAHEGAAGRRPPKAETQRHRAAKARACSA